MPFKTRATTVFTVFLSTLIVFLCLFIKPTFAVDYTVSGHVTNSSGTGIGGVTVEVKNPSNGATVATTSTATSPDTGFYSLAIAEGIYNIQLTPQAGSGSSPAIALNQNINSNKTLNYVLTPSGTSSLNGFIRDAQGLGLSNQTVDISNSQSGLHTIVTTDQNGFYSLQVSPGNYNLQIKGINNNFAPHASQYYNLNSNVFVDLNQSVSDYNFNLPFKKVELLVKNQAGQGVGGIRIQTTPTSLIYGDLPIGNGILANASSAYGVQGTTGPGPLTDQSGRVDLYLFPSLDNFATYTFSALPPSGSPYSPTFKTNIAISTDTQESITVLEPVTISGHIRDRDGVSLVNQTVDFGHSQSGVHSTATTDQNGFYSVSFAPGDYNLQILGNNPLTVHAPQYSNVIASLTVNQDTSDFDINLPYKKVDLHVQNSQNQPVSGVEIKTLPSGFPIYFGLDIGNGLSANAISAYGRSGTGAFTDNNGDVTLWLFPTQTGGSTYSFVATPPSGGANLTTTLSDIAFSSDNQRTIILETTSVTVSGVIKNALGTALPNQTVDLGNAQSGVHSVTTTDQNGFYSITVPKGDYNFQLKGINNDFSLNASQYYNLVTSTTFNQNTPNFNFILPFKKVSIQILNHLNQPVPGIQLQTQPFSPIHFDLPIGNGLLANATSVYGLQGTTAAGPTTNLEGKVDLWLFETQAGGFTYSYGAIPPAGSIYNQFTVSNRVVTGDLTELIFLEYNHPTPTTTVTLTPEADSEGNYSDPTTVTLSAVAASGYSVAATKYTLDGSAVQDYTAPFNVSTEGDHTIMYWSIDNSGVEELHKTTTFTIHANQAPEIDPIEEATLSEGDDFSHTGSFTDSDSTSWTATIDYGNGGGPNPLTLTGNSFQLNHQYKDNGQFTISLVITDDEGAITTETVEVTVSNINPTLSAITAPSDPVLVNSVINVSATFNDQGALDTHTASWDWGDSSTSTGSVTETNGSGSVANSHIYTAPGVYMITLTLTDKDNGSASTNYQYIAVYNEGTSFAGGRSFTSPAGAFTQNPPLAGKVTFGVSVKYSNSNTITGDAKMYFKDADLDFITTSVQYLVTSNGKATLRGTGTINGVGNYDLLVTGIDGSVVGGEDLVRFQIKETSGNVVFDSQSGAADSDDPNLIVATGNIRIH